MSKITINVNNGTGKLVYWLKLRKLGLPGKFSLIPVSKIDSIVWTYPPEQVGGARGCGILTISAEDTIYSYSFFASSLETVEEIIRQVETASQQASRCEHLKSVPTGEQGG